MIKKFDIKFLLSIITGAFCLMFDAFYNKFPIVYSDTSTYIASGFELETPFDRPITYGLFLRLASFNGLSLWLVIFFQALILSYLLLLLVKRIVREDKFYLLGIILVLFLSLFTGVSWTVSQVMPDIFTSIALLSAALILIGGNTKRQHFLLYFLFFLSVAMHMSHLLLFVMILAFLFLTRIFIFPKRSHNSVNMKTGIMLALTVSTIVTMGSALSKSKHVFFMGAMVEHGILKKYLDDNCGIKQYKLCAYKDSLPNRAYEFIWDTKSPFYKTGGWQGTKDEFNEIISRTLTKPRYLMMHVKASLSATGEQLLLYKINDGNGSFLQGTLLYERISKYFSNDLASYSASRQNQHDLNFTDTWNYIFSIVFIMSLLSLVALPFVYRNIYHGHFTPLLILLLTGIILNAWSCGTFANAIDRLGCKMIWLIPFLAGIAFCKLYLKNVDSFKKLVVNGKI